MIIPSLDEMSALVRAMLKEWEVAMHNAAVAPQKQLEGQQQGQQASAEAAVQEIEKQAAPDLHVVEDLVQDIKEKPE